MTTDIFRAYKVVRYYPRPYPFYCSAVAIYPVVKYPIGRRTFPPFLCGPLTVFNRLRYAKQFATNIDLPRVHSKIKIFRCEYAPAAPIFLNLCASEKKKVKIWGYKFLEKWWKDEYKFLLRERSPCIFPPPGTRFARWVRLLEEVSL